MSRVTISVHRNYHEDPLTFDKVANRGVTPQTTIGELRAAIAEAEGVVVAAVRLNVGGNLAEDDAAKLGSNWDEENRFTCDLVECDLHWNDYGPINVSRASLGKCSLGKCSKCNRATSDGMDGWSWHQCGHFVCGPCRDEAVGAAMEDDSKAVLCPVCRCATEKNVTFDATGRPVRELVCGPTPSIVRVEGLAHCKLGQNCTRRATVKADGTLSCAVHLEAKNKVSDENGFNTTAGEPVTLYDLLRLRHGVGGCCEKQAADRYCDVCGVGVCPYCQKDHSHQPEMCPFEKWGGGPGFAARRWSDHAQCVVHVEAARDRALKQREAVLDNEKDLLAELDAQQQERLRDSDAQFDREIANLRKIIADLEEGKKNSKENIAKHINTLKAKVSESAKECVRKMETHVSQLNGLGSEVLDRLVLLKQTMEAGVELLRLKGTATDYVTPYVSTAKAEACQVKLQKLRSVPLPPRFRYKLNATNTIVSLEPAYDDTLNVTLEEEPQPAFSKMQFAYGACDVLSAKDRPWVDGHSQLAELTVNAFHLLTNDFSYDYEALYKHVQAGLRAEAGHDLRDSFESVFNSAAAVAQRTADGAEALKHFAARCGVALAPAAAAGANNNNNNALTYEAFFQVLSQKN